MRLFLLFFITLLVFALYGCPHQIVPSLEKHFTNKPKTVYKTRSVQAGSLIKLDSAAIAAHSQKMDSLETFMPDSAQPTAVPIILEVRAINADKYPDEVEIRALIYDTLGRYISGLAPPYFSLPGAWRDYWSVLTDSCLGIKYSVKDFKVEELREKTSPPSAIAIALDHSPSMMHKRALILQEAVSRLLNVIKPGDYISVIKFTKDIYLEVPMTDTAEVFRSKFKKDGLTGYGGGTAMFDGVMAAISELKKAPKTHNRVVILFSDGMDNQSKATIDAVELSAKAEGIAVYAIAFGMGFTDAQPLERLANRTGGKFYHIFTTKEFPYVFADIYISLNNYYKITYKPPECAGFHSVGFMLDLALINREALFGDGSYDKSIFKVDDPVGSVTFMNIEFDFGKATVKRESHQLIEQVAHSMKANPQLRIKICGHTDDVGDDEYNLKLSKERAEAVGSELAKIGISRSRLETEGFGKTMPIVPNDSEENRRKNRRTEFIIIAK